MKKPDLDMDTPLIPEVIADVATQDRELARLMCERARWHYANDGNFRRNCRSTRGRDYLGAFMDHWAKAGVQKMSAWVKAARESTST